MCCARGLSAKMYHFHSPLALAVEINAIDLSLDLIKTNIVKTLEARATDSPHPVVGNKEMLFPAHENMLALCYILYHNCGTPTCLFGVRSKGGELGPVGQIGLIVGPPAFMFCNEAILVPDNLALEVCRQRGVVVGQPWRVGSGSA
jgi:hypothetical protein